MVQRMGRIIGINPEDIPRYKELHENPLQDLIERLRKRNIRNFSIFLREPENLLFSYWEYTGTDFAADQAKGRDDPEAQAGWALTDPLQRPLDSRAEGEWWSPMEQIFFAE